MTDLTGKVAVITGGGTGLGAAVALGLAQRGAHILVNYSRSASDAEQVAARCRELGVDALAVQGSVAEDADCTAIAAAAIARWSRINILINAAGTTKFAPARELDALSADDFLAIYKINVVGAYQMTRAVAPAMRDAGRGSVVNVSSISSLDGSGSSIAYAASKGALNTMTLALARALAPTISVNAVLPGFMATRWFSDGLGPDALERISASQRATTPLQRAGTAEDIAKAVLFLADEGSEHITGAMLVSDAGQHLGSVPPPRTEK